MRLVGRRLVSLAAVAAVGVLASLSIGSSLALFSSTAAPASVSFTAGHVALTGNPSSTCTLKEGQEWSSCHYPVTCRGDISAWVGIGLQLGSGVESVYLQDDQGQTFRFSPNDSGYQLVNVGYSPTGRSSPPRGVQSFNTTFTITKFRLAPGSTSGNVVLSGIAVESAFNPLAKGEPSW